MLDFQPINLGIKTLVDSYTFKYGEGSCQHSFVSSWCLRHRYSDAFCEHDGFLYTLRTGMCTPSQRIYLFPYGSRNDPHTLKRAVQNVIDDAHSHNSRAKFKTVTQSARDALTSLFPGMFTQEYSRDWSEYVYSSQALATYSGPKMAYKRRDFERFRRDYSGRFEVRLITAGDIPALRTFQEQWLKDKVSRSQSEYVSSWVAGENVGITSAFDDWESLDMTGIIVLIDGEIRGYAYGAKLSEDYMDEHNENCDKNYPNIHPFTKHEFARLCCEGIKYINFEEDTGSETLRRSKEHYKPAFLIDKFTLTEK